MWAGGGGPPSGEGRRLSPPRLAHRSLRDSGKVIRPERVGDAGGRGQGQASWDPGKETWAGTEGGPLGDRCPPPPTRQAAGWGPEEAP